MRQSRSANGRSLDSAHQARETCGYDFTWSVPKSVSLLYGLTEDKELLNAFRDSVEETMRDIEVEMKTRVRKGRKEEDRLTGNGVWCAGPAKLMWTSAHWFFCGKIEESPRRKTQLETERAEVAHSR